MAHPTENLPHKQRVIVQEKIIVDQKDIILTLKKSVHNLEEMFKKEQISNEEKQQVLIQQQNTITEQQSTVQEQDNIIRDQQISIVSQQKDLSISNQEIKVKTEQLLRINSEWENQTALLKNKIVDMKNELTEKDKKYEKLITEREEKFKAQTQKIKELEIVFEKSKSNESGLVPKNIVSEMEEEIKQFEKLVFEKDKEIKDLHEHLEGGNLDLKAELEIRDISIKDLENRISRLTGDTSIPTPAGERGNIILSKNSAIDGISGLIRSLKSTGMVFIPTIEYIEDLNLSDLKNTIRLKLATFIDVKNQKHIELFKKYNSLNNIEIKMYDQKDLWAINKDLEILLFAPIGDNNSIAGLIVQSDNQIDFFASLLNSSWTARCKSVRL